MSGQYTGCAQGVGPYLLFFRLLFLRVADFFRLLFLRVAFLRVAFFRLTFLTVLFLAAFFRLTFLTVLFLAAFFFVARFFFQPLGILPSFQNVGPSGHVKYKGKNSSHHCESLSYYESDDRSGPALKGPRLCTPSCKQQG